jgi:antibiotic biosynthesis monooxygenase (ABM) superfamily enzyme
LPQLSGLLDWQTIRPIPDLTLTNTVIIRFDTHDHLQNWLFSEDRKQLIAKVLPLLSGDDDFFVRSGLDFWFAPEGAKAKLPVRWKQFLITWSAIYPLVLLMPLIVLPLFQVAGLPQNQYLATLCVTGLVVFNMVYVVMPRYTKLVHRWLFK